MTRNIEQATPFRRPASRPRVANIAETCGPRALLGTSVVHILGPLPFPSAFVTFHLYYGEMLRLASRQEGPDSTGTRRGGPGLAQRGECTARLERTCLFDECAGVIAEPRTICNVDTGREL